MFVFDINTKAQLAALVDREPAAHWFGDGNLFVINVSSAGRGVVTWELRVFERVRGSEYRLHEEDVCEISFPAERIKKELERRFSRVWIYDARRSRPSPRSERLHFVCAA